MLDANPALHVTCILGRRFRRIYPRIRDLRAKMCIRDRIYAGAKVISVFFTGYSAMGIDFGNITVGCVIIAFCATVYAVSYTHLDVYKRQA